MHSVLAFRSLRGGAAALSTEAALVLGYLHSRSAGRGKARHRGAGLQTGPPTRPWPQGPEPACYPFR